MDLTNNSFVGNCLMATANGKNVLILRKTETPFKRFDGKRVSYELEYRWLSKDATPEGDEICCARGQDFTHWSLAELVALGWPKKTNLFDMFNLW